MIQKLKNCIYVHQSKNVLFLKYLCQSRLLYGANLLLKMFCHNKHRLCFPLHILNQNLLFGIFYDKNDHDINQPEIREWINLTYTLIHQQLFININALLFMTYESFALNYILFLIYPLHPLLVNLFPDLSTDIVENIIVDVYNLGVIALK